ncbi:unnamed protein product (macronuclear) [Paramecium tetraurelia]|uniref:Uncharacterized protein n=1 Tax=Paramecium tetraurelia TaxID=5888 RepID=A0BG64_PARTE|nr:uncharacterized protein GSPATT00028566001 [Paramecium tetraurelia]CAK57531.1 unnamed protein product [Paramecium tetraurelia]|eukprot:XP_001424929.1 hypothetical protein (macronuclear) [Paramecium tetraurelia strain d4-2]
MQHGKYRVALQFFGRFKNFLETNNLKEKEWVDVSRRIVYSNLQLRRYEDAEAQLEEIIRQFLRQKANYALVYSAYSDLLTHCLKYNLNKAILLGKALLSEMQRENVPLGYQKQYLYFLGTAYLLKENYTDAKSRMRECLASDPSNQLKGWAYNSFGCGFMVAQISNDDEEETGPLQSDIPVENIDADFENVIPLFKKSIYYIEHSNNQIKTGLEWLLNDDLLPQDKTNLTKTQFKSIHVGKPLLNLSEFVLNKAPSKRTELQFWLKTTINFYEEQDPTNMDRSLLFLAWTCSTNKYFDRAESMYRIVLQMLENSDSYNKVLCMQLLGSMLKKMPNRSKLIIKAQQIAEELPYWSNRQVHIIIPDFEI